MASETSTPSPSRRRFGAGALLLVAVFSGGLGIGTGLIFHVHDHVHEGGAGATPASARETWQCPMHPTIVQDHPGECPICGMKLVKVATPVPGGGSGPQAPKGERRLAFYRNPMGNGETSPVPMKDSMGMDYIPVYEDELNGATAASAEVEGLTAVSIDPDRQQLIGLRTAPAELGSVGGAWRTNGKVTVDETRVHHVNLKVGGFVGHSHAGFVGQTVKKGEPLFTLYSPELLAAQDEYLLALRTRDQLRKSGMDGSDGNDLVESARRKLELWDIPEAEIQRLEEAGQAEKELTFYAPASGVITKRDALPGMRVNAGDMPIEMVDLSRVWVLADVYESELRHVKVGMSATLSLKAYPNRTFKGRVAFIAPQLDPATRTVAVRLEFANPTGELKPEMFGEVVLQGSSRRGLRIPSDAVIDSGTKNIVFLALGEGKFQPREVQLGDADGDRVEVMKGLSPGDRVVTRANFLIDSESRLKASLAALSGGQKAPDHAGAGTPSASGSAPVRTAPATAEGGAGAARD
ncbi:MAG TPA: efflux RND transporter periplasmic adaptor subunit [Anaeromyxobacter sp.]|nr:efflux RND transporter periplasmic adaptor subunit [Anaeromyxobacter sp.]